MARYKPHYMVHRTGNGNYYVQFTGSDQRFHIMRGVPAGITKVHYYAGTVWYPTLRDAVYSII